MIRKRICQIFCEVQQSTNSHLRYKQILKKIYKENVENIGEFEAAFMYCVEKTLVQDVGKNSAEKVLQFVATFIVGLVSQPKDKLGPDIDHVLTLNRHPFFDFVVFNVLELHDQEDAQIRYHVCLFLNVLFEAIGEDAVVEEEICVAIQNAMFFNIKDLKPQNRLQAVKVLGRLQVPRDPNCPVIKMFLECIVDPNASVRKEIVIHLAPVVQALPKLLQRVLDVDHTVRKAAFDKMGQIGPKPLRIVDRQSFLIDGFKEANETVKSFFLKTVLSKWLKSCGNDYLKLLSCVQLDAYEDDYVNTAWICRRVMDAFLQVEPLSEIIGALHLDESKLIPLEKLNFSSALLWSILCEHFRKDDKLDEYLNETIPELSKFTRYIDKFVTHKEKHKVTDNWDYMEYQQILVKLLEIASEADLADEVGRKALQELVVKLLSTTRNSSSVIKILITIMHKLIPNMDNLTLELCSIISEIRSPLVEVLPTSKEVEERAFKLAELRVKLNIAQDDCEQALSQQDFERVIELKEIMKTLQVQVKELNEKFDSIQSTFRPSQPDAESTCYALDVLIQILSFPHLKKLTLALRSCKEEFIKPLVGNSGGEMYRKVFKIIVLFSILDKQIALENLKFILTPLLAYRLMPSYDKETLLTSRAGICDLLRIYGPEILDKNDNGDNNLSIGTRRLYGNSDFDLQSFDIDGITCQDVIETLLLMLDDETEEVREAAGLSLSKLILDKITLSPTVFSRMILKWLNPATATDKELQRILGTTIQIASCAEGNEEMVEQSILPVLTALGNAPCNSPLIDVNIDNAVRFLSALAATPRKDLCVFISMNLWDSLCTHILAKPKSRCVPIFIRMLMHLHLTTDDSLFIKELSDRLKLILEKIEEKSLKRTVTKLLAKVASKDGYEENVAITREQEEESGEKSVDEKNEVGTSKNRRKSRKKKGVKNNGALQNETFGTISLNVADKSVQETPTRLNTDDSSENQGDNSEKTVDNISTRRSNRTRTSTESNNSTSLAKTKVLSANSEKTVPARKSNAVQKRPESPKIQDDNSEKTDDKTPESSNSTNDSSKNQGDNSEETVDKAPTRRSNRTRTSTESNNSTNLAKTKGRSANSEKTDPARKSNRVPKIQGNNGVINNESSVIRRLNDSMTSTASSSSTPVLRVILNSSDIEIYQANKEKERNNGAIPKRTRAKKINAQNTEKILSDSNVTQKRKSKRTSQNARRQGEISGETGKTLDNEENKRKIGRAGKSDDSASEERVLKKRYKPDVNESMTRNRSELDDRKDVKKDAKISTNLPKTNIETRSTRNGTLPQTRSKAHKKKK